MLKSIISIMFCVIFLSSFSQQKTQKVIKPIITKKDSTLYKTPYGLRLGMDISKPILSYFDKSYKGFEIVSDYRISKKLYIACELGYEKEITYEDYTTSTSRGNYLRLGVNYNLYKNWLNMNNEIFIGGRYGFSIFDQTLNSYIQNLSTTYFNGKINNNPITQKKLKIHWLEFQLGTKVETFKNLFIGFHGSYKIGIIINNQNNFKTLYTPGFNRVYSSKTGFGFNYTVSYLIPFYKK